MKSAISFKNKAFTLIEVLLGILIIGFISVFIFSILQNINRVLIGARISLQILSALQDEIEKIRVLKYEDIGIQGSWPPGVLPPEKIINKGDMEIKLNFFVRNIDDPKDGTVASAPRDTAPADYKLVEIEGECLNCTFKTKKQVLTTFVAPKTVEALTNNGSMFIQVIDAKGKPVSEASVKVDYLNTPQFTIRDITDLTGVLRLIDIPAGIKAYSIYVTKNGYSYDKTYQEGPEYPNPVIPHQTVKSGELTTVTFQIDLLSKLKVKTQDVFCGILPGVSFRLTGIKPVNTDPFIPKTDITTTTDENGNKELDVEFDNYYLKIADTRYVLRSSVPFLEEPFNVEPNKIYSFNLTLNQKKSIDLLVSVFDEQGDYLDGATVGLSKSNFYVSKITGEENVAQNDWSNNNYSEISTGIDPETFPGEIRLKDLGGYFSTSTEWLISKTIDFGVSTIDYKKFTWLGNIATGTSIKFQIATNNDNLTWNFVGPDGTNNTYFETQEFDIPAFLDNKRYLRYKVFLTTNDPIITPILDKVDISFSSPCFSKGQVLFQNLKPGNYNLEVTKPGYSFYNKNVVLSDEEFYHEKVNLTP
jgi:prepilin-type N-terminal cleavage/methylation domain-containing protein